LFTIYYLLQAKFKLSTLLSFLFFFSLVLSLVSTLSLATWLFCLLSKLNFYFHKNEWTEFWEYLLIPWIYFLKMKRKCFRVSEFISKKMNEQNLSSTVSNFTCNKKKSEIKKIKILFFKPKSESPDFLELSSVQQVHTGLIRFRKIFYRFRRLLVFGFLPDRCCDRSNRVVRFLQHWSHTNRDLVDVYS
jgi:hypothetical protein